MINSNGVVNPKMETLLVRELIYSTNRPTQPKVSIGTVCSTWGISTLGNKTNCYKFEIQYRLGMENKAASALSRIPLPIELAAIPFPMVVDVQLIMKQVEANLREDFDS